MASGICAGNLFLLASVWVFSGTNSVGVVFEHGHYNGVSLYISTSKKLIQEKLDQWYHLNSKTCYGPRLYLPTYSVVKDIPSDQHVIYIDFGTEAFKEFERSEAGVPDSQLNTTVFQFTILIPFLSSTPRGAPQYAIAVAIFYDKHMGKFPLANAVFPYIPVDEIAVEEGSVVVTNGTEEIRVSFAETVPCEAPEPIVREQFDKFLFDFFQVPYDGPQGFEFCDSYPRQNDYCDAVNKIRYDAYKFSPDICQKWFSIGEGVDCAVSCDEIQISPGFRDYIPIGASEDIKAFAARRIIFDGGILFKYPCFE